MGKKLLWTLLVIALLAAATLAAGCTSLSSNSSNGNVSSPSSSNIHFSGYEWTVKSSSERVGPGPNYFSNSDKNVWVDGHGQLHLKATYVNGKWYCAEVISQRQFGYGQYRFYVTDSINRLNKNAVLGLFTWDDNPAYHHREIDIEFSRYNQTSNDNARFAVQPYTNPPNTQRFNLEIAGNYAVQSFDWRSQTVSFLSLTDSPSPSAGANGSHVAASWAYRGDDVPIPGNEHARINLWLYHGNPPSNLKDVEIIINKFEFVP